ncbi:hypothetical protein, partial [Peribacillus sp. SIMBA_075]|uniref:hypothetical protein n=1 Tax=Peribacillus sp. SIMBA_075 TaxID=3085813 RepID=UPI003979AA20
DLYVFGRRIDAFQALARGAGGTGRRAVFPYAQSDAQDDKAANCRRIGRGTGEVVQDERPGGGRPGSHPGNG